MDLSLAAALGSNPGAAVFNLGFAQGDQVTGTSFPYAFGTQTLRFSNLPFSCYFSAPSGPGLYVIELGFVEPTVFEAGARIFSVTLTDWQGMQKLGEMQNVDLFSMGAVDSSVMIARQFVVFLSDGRFRVNLTTVKRSAVISRVAVLPLTVAMTWDSGGV